MGIFTTLFKNKKDLNIKNTQRLVNLFTPYFSDNADRLFNDTFMSCIEAHAKHCSKIKPAAYLGNKPTKEHVTKILSLSPNPIMEAGAFWEKAARNYFLDHNLFIYIDWDLSNPKEPLRSLWILDPDTIDVRTDNEDIYFKFNLRGQEITTNSENIIHVARNVDHEEIFGKSNNAIKQVLKVINTNYEGMEQAIKTSGFLRFVLSVTTPLTDKDKAKKAKDFAETYLKPDNYGVAYIDSSTKLDQIDTSKARYANADEMKHLEEKILKYLGISNPILLGNFNENEWQSYYETSIEPFVNKLANELTIKLFTSREIAQGNRIVISSKSLQVTSTQTKINLVTNTKELGIFTINEYRELFNMPPIEGGDIRLTSLNYINAEKADEYQLGKLKGGIPNEPKK